MRVFAYVFAWWTAIGQLRAALSPISVLGDIQETHMQNLPFLFSLFATGELCCGFELLVLVGSSWCVPRWRVSSVFPNYWCHEACTRDGNNVRFLGSATAWPLEAIWLRSALHHHLFSGRIWLDQLGHPTKHLCVFLILICVIYLPYKAM